MSSVEVVYHHVLAALMRGELSPGTWLRQDDLAAEVGVSKIPVREALQRLAADGLVRFESNRGSVVRELDADDAEEIYVMRMALEPALIERAIPKMTIVHLAEAELALQDTSAPVVESNWRFHRALYAAADWPRAEATVARLQAAVAPYVVLYTDGLRGAPVSDAQHVELLEWCRRKDARRAKRALVDHLADASGALLAFLQHR